MSKLGKQYIRIIYCHPTYLTYIQSTSCKHARLVEVQAGIKIARRNISNLRYADDTTLMAERWENSGNSVRLLFLGAPKITADGDCCHEIKRHLLLGRKAMTNLDSILKARGITLPTKVRLVQAIVFPVVMCVCESWTIKKAEH